MSTPVVLGLDAGGTTTRALVVDHRGRVLGAGRGGSGNPTSAGPKAALHEWAQAARSALDCAGASPAEVEAVVVALAGQPQLAPAPELRGRLGLHPRTLVRTESDVLAMYHSGADEDEGLVAIAGTGSIGAHITSGNVTRLVGGSGWLLGDAGSGFATGRRVARAAVADLDGSGPHTTLTPAVLASYGLQTTGAHTLGRPRVLTELIDAVYAARPIHLSKLAPLAFAAPKDEVAAAIVRTTHDELAALLTSLRGPVDSPAHDLPLVVGGSVLELAVLDKVTTWSPALRSALAGCSPRRAHDGAVGAGVLALRAVGIHVRPAELAAAPAVTNDSGSPPLA